MQIVKCFGREIKTTNCIINIRTLHGLDQCWVGLSSFRDPLGPGLRRFFDINQFFFNI
jgi:hypothetical protein